MFFDNQQAVVETLQQHGFENISVKSRSDSALVIYYENRMYRNELYASAIVTALVENRAGDSTLVLVPCRRAMPICELYIDLESYRAFCHGTGADAQPAFVRIKDVSETLPFWPSGLTQPARGKIELMMSPSVAVYFGNYDDRFKMFFALMPVVRTTLWKGAALFAEASIPIYNDVNYDFMRYRDYAQLSKAAFSQVFELPFHVLGHFSAGVYNPHRWGLAGEINKLFMNRHLSVGYSFEYTGFLLYYDKLWNYSKLNLTTDKFYIWYYSDLFNSQIGLSYNSYVMQDSGLLFEFQRNYRDTTIGFFFGETELDKFGGITIRFPLAASKRPKPRLVRLTLPRYYDYSYRANKQVYAEEAPVQSGVTISTGTKLTYFYEHLTPNYIKHSLFLYKEAFDAIRINTKGQGEDEYLLQFLKK